MNWQVTVIKKAEKQIRKLPAKDSFRVRLAIDEMGQNPFVGDTQKMNGEENTWRRRVGSYRIIYEIYTTQKVVLVFKVKRRTSSTY